MSPDLDTAARPAHRSFRLTRPSTAAAVASQVRPAIVLPDREARALLAAAERLDVSRGGCFSAGPAGVQLWSGPWDGALGRHGSSVHLGSVDWSYDTPSRHYITVYRVMVTHGGAAAGQTPLDVLGRVLGLVGLTADAARLGTPERTGLPVPPPRDPFSSAAVRSRSIELPD